MKKILIVEDDSNMRKLLADAFKKAKFEVAEAENGQVGLDVGKDFGPDFILLDVMMPVMDGMGMLENLRKEPWGQDVLVTILSNSDDIVKISGALESGVRGYIIKSDMAVEDIVKRVEKELGMAK